MYDTRVDVDSVCLAGRDARGVGEEEVKEVVLEWWWLRGEGDACV